jgi:hypothetical protein
MLYFATLFDINYLTRGLTLYNSLTKCCSQEIKLFIIALDDEIYSFLCQKAFWNIEIIKLCQIEEHYNELLIVKNTRNIVEYYFTLSPYLPLYILEKFDFIDRITTLDADLMFFSDPGKIFSYYSDASVLITPHDFFDENIYEKKFGKYNVSFQSFKRDEKSFNVLNDWRIKCYEWCYDHYDDLNLRYADQLYLENWLHDFPGVEEIRIVGAGLAPWNLAKHKLSINNNDELEIDGGKLIYYHFQLFRMYNLLLSLHGLTYYKANPRNKVIKEIYFRYIKAIKKVKKNTNDVVIKRGAVNKTINHIIQRDDLYVFTPLGLFYVYPYKFIHILVSWLKSKT